MTERPISAVEHCPNCAAMHERLKFAEDEAVRQARIANGTMADADRLRAAALAVDEAWGAWINHDEGEGFDAVVDAIGNLRATLDAQ